MFTWPVPGAPRYQRHEPDRVPRGPLRVMPSIRFMETEINTPISIFLRKISNFLNDCGFDPLPGSLAEKEIRSFPRTESIQTAFSIGSQSLVAANDYLKALDTLVYFKIFSVAPWSCARGMIEAAAISMWLLDKAIDSKERVGRSLSLRFASMNEQIKMARYDNDNAMIQKLEKRIEDVDRIAIDLGYAPARDKKNRRIGIGQKKPNITELIESQFKGEKIYRILSGMAHSNYTSLTSLSFTNENINRRSGAVMREAVPITIQESLVSHSATIFVKCLWLKIIQYGFDAAKAAILLETFYDDLKLSDKNEYRFWRTVIDIKKI
jgi:hypothetical protein